MWFLAMFLVVLNLCSFSPATAVYLKNTNVEQGDQNVYEKYVGLDKSLKNFVSDGIKIALPYVMEASEHLNLSSGCTSNLLTVMSGVKKLKLSALKFLDASGKVPPGLISGSLSMFGDYDECLNIEVLRTNGKKAFQGQYCMLDIKPVLPKKKNKLTIEGGLEDLVEYAKNTSEVIQFMLSKIQYGYVRSAKYGLCVPSGCTTGDIRMMMNYLNDKAFMNATVQYCDQEGDLKMHPGMIAAIFFFSVIGLLCIVGSFIDYHSKKKEIRSQKKITSYLKCFSILKNFPKVISTKSQDTILTSVFGIRTLSVFFIILMHQYFCWGYFPVQGNLMIFNERIPQFFFQITFNGLLTTEVFFFLGGLLNMYSRMRLQESGKHQLTVLQILIHRLWRIYPTYIFSLLTFYLFVNVRGPLATYVREDFITTCDDKWWKNLLFINNFLNQDKLCMPHTWYISVDMQLFFISLFTVPVLLKSAKMGMILHVAILIVGLLSTILWVWYKDVMPSLLIYYLDLDDLQKMRNAYVTTPPHIAPYYVGLIVGYILSKWKDFKIAKIYRLFGWPIASACFVSMLFITQKWNSGVEFTVIESALYFAFCRFLYVLAVAWMVVCCAKGYGSILNYILSLKIWIPLTRISYMVYMISPVLQFYYYASLRMRINVDYMTLIWRHIGDLGVSCLMGLAMVVIIESPFISMEKLIFHRPQTKKERSPDDLESSEKHNNKENIIKQVELDKNEKNINGIFTEIELEKNYQNMDEIVKRETEFENSDKNIDCEDTINIK